MQPDKRQMPTSVMLVCNEAQRQTAPLPGVGHPVKDARDLVQAHQECGDDVGIPFAGVAARLLRQLRHGEAGGRCFRCFVRCLPPLFQDRVTRALSWTGQKIGRLQQGWKTQGTVSFYRVLPSSLFANLTKQVGIDNTTLTIEQCMG